MNLDKNINDIVSIFQSFKENDDFYHELMKESYSTGNDEEAKKITRARDEFKNNYKISKNTIELIKTNFDKYIKIIKSLNEKDKNKQNDFKTSNETYNINIDSNQLANNETFTFSTNTNNFNNKPINNKSINNEFKKKSYIGNNISNNTQEVPEEPIIDDSNLSYSSKIAKNNLNQQLTNVTNQINIIKSNINNSKKMLSKIEYQKLFQLESYRNKIIEKLENINLEESYNNNQKVVNRDKELNNIYKKITDNKKKLQSNKPNFVKVVINHRLEALKKKQGRIENRQRNIVNKDLLKYYKDSFKNSKLDSHDNAINQYYQDKKDLLQEKKDKILDNVDIYNNGILTNIKNKFFKFKSLPASIKLSYIEGIQEQIKNKDSRLNGFRHLNKDIVNKLYPIIQNKKQQIIDQLKAFNGYLKNSSDTQQYNQGMEYLFNNLSNNQPVLEEKSSMRRL